MGRQGRMHRDRGEKLLRSLWGPAGERRAFGRYHVPLGYLSAIYSRLRSSHISLAIARSDECVRTGRTVITRILQSFAAFRSWMAAVTEEFEIAYGSIFTLCQRR